MVWVAVREPTAGLVGPSMLRSTGARCGSLPPSPRPTVRLRQCPTDAWPSGRPPGARHHTEWWAHQSPHSTCSRSSRTGCRSRMRCREKGARNSVNVATILGGVHAQRQVGSRRRARRGCPLTSWTSEVVSTVKSALYDPKSYCADVPKQALNELSGPVLLSV
jgi:hypothetical protein